MNEFLAVYFIQSWSISEQGATQVKRKLSDYVRLGDPVFAFFFQVIPAFAYGSVVEWTVYVAGQGVWTDTRHVGHNLSPVTGLIGL